RRIFAEGDFPLEPIRFLARLLQAEGLAVIADLVAPPLPLEAIDQIPDLARAAFRVAPDAQRKALRIVVEIVLPAALGRLHRFDEARGEGHWRTPIACRGNTPNVAPDLRGNTGATN